MGHSDRADSRQDRQREVEALGQLALERDREVDCRKADHDPDDQEECRWAAGGPQGDQPPRSQEGKRYEKPVAKRVVPEGRGWRRDGGPCLENEISVEKIVLIENRGQAESSSNRRLSQPGDG